MYISINSRDSCSHGKGKETWINEEQYDLSVTTDNPMNNEPHPWYISVTGEGRYGPDLREVDRRFTLVLTPDDVQKLLDELSLRGQLSTELLLTKPTK